MLQAGPPPELQRVLAVLARGVLGDGYRPEVPARMYATLARLACEQDRAQLRAVLRALDTRAGALALTGRAVPVSWLGPAEAEALIVRLQGSRLPQLRRLGKSVVSLALASLYGYPSPEWQRIGYQGPMGPPPDEPRRLAPLEVTSDDVLSCDVVIVGSGAGAGVSAAVLAEAGYDVVVLEKGGYLAERDFNHLEAEAIAEMYLYGMTLATTDLSVRIIAGSTLGGGTVVNYTTSFKTPDFVRDEWARVSGVEAFRSGEFEESLDAVAKRLNVNTDSSSAGRRDELMEEGLKKLGWHVDLLPRAVKGCTQDEACGFCGFGCRVGGKQSTMRTFLEDAAGRGTRLVVRADVRKVTISDGRATGVEAVVGGKHRLVVKARAVIAGCGAIETPALLLRSGLRGEVGKHLRLHPGTSAFGIFDEDVRMWEGTLQARYSAEFRDWDGGYGPIFETVPVHPGSGSAAVPWVSASQHREMMGRFGKLSLCAVLPRDASEGRVRIGKDGNPRVEYRLSAADERRIAEGVIQAARVLEAAGAREIYSPHPGWLSYYPDRAGDFERWAEETRRRGYSGGKVTFFSFHQMGSCRMGVDPSSSAVGPDNQSHEVAGLYVMDGSCFPTASGVNPMLSIYGIAHRGAKLLAERLS